MNNTTRKTLGVLLTLTVLAMASQAVEAGSPRTLELQRPAMVGDTFVAKGIYKVRWEPNGSGYKLMLSQNGSLVAEAHAEMVKLEQPIKRDVQVLATDADGRTRLRELKFRKLDHAIVLDS